jgi:hypothetical protein
LATASPAEHVVECRCILILTCFIGFSWFPGITGVEQKYLKQSFAALSTVLLEAAKHDKDADSLRLYFLEQLDPIYKVKSFSFHSKFTDLLFIAQ